MVLYLVDGDNYPERGSKGLEAINSCFFNNKIIIVANSATKLSNYQRRIRTRNPKLFHEARLGFIKVSKISQAADNRIKSIIGQKDIREQYETIFIISHDSDFPEYLKKLGKRGINIKNIYCKGSFAECTI